MKEGALEASFENVVEEVCRALGIQIILTREPKGAEYDFRLRLAAFPEGKGLILLARHGFLQWTFDLRLEDFSAQLLDLMRKRAKEREPEFVALLGHAVQTSNVFDFKSSGFDLKSLMPSEWTDFSFVSVYEYSRHQDAFGFLFDRLLATVSVPLCLLEDSPEWTVEGEAQVEGNLKIVESRKYERSRYNRAICLHHYGFSCRGCGTRMAEKYGPLTKEIIEVHHIVPVSQMEKPKRLDPIKDLVPLCPNCHSVIHSQSSPMSVLELRGKTGFVADDIYQLL